MTEKKPIKQKILVRSPNWVGDAIMASAVPTALKKTNPDCEVHVLARSWVAPVWIHHPDVDHVIRLDQKSSQGIAAWFDLVVRLRQQAFTDAVVLPNSFSSAWLVFWSGIPKRVGYAADQRSWLLSHPVAWNKSLAQWSRPKIYLNLARQAGADVDVCQEIKFTVKVTAEELAGADALLPKTEKGIIGLAPGSVAPSRRWPAERYAQLGDRLAQQGYAVVLVGSPQDRTIADKVARKMKNKPLITAGETQLRAGLAVIRKLNLLVSNDSGAMHMAYAQGVPVLVLQGAADYMVTGPFGKDSHVIRDKSVTCAPCVKNECPKKHMKCMKNITVDTVWDKVNEILDKKKKND